MKSLHGKSVYWSVFGKRYFVSCALLALIVSSCGGNTDEFVSSQQSFLIGDSLPGLSAQQALDFAAGRVAFLEEEGLADGLGPVFNEKSCANCHSVGAVGGEGAQFERRAGKTVSGKFDSLGSEGGQLFDLFSVNSLGPTDRAQIPGCTLPASGEPIPGDDRNHVVDDDFDVRRARRCRRPVLDRNLVRTEERGDDSDRELSPQPIDHAQRLQLVIE